jgi:proteasome lid subunit RPN8/RPN11
MWRIKRSLLEDACAAAQRYYPDEFMCFLGGDRKKKTVEEIVMLPNTSGEDFATISETVIPIDEGIVGSLHSHPDSSGNPSDEDRRFFRRHGINVILGHPFAPENARFYSQKGERIRVEVG